MDVPAEVLAEGMGGLPEARKGMPDTTVELDGWRIVYRVALDGFSDEWTWVAIDAQRI